MPEVDISGIGNSITGDKSTQAFLDKPCISAENTTADPTVFTGDCIQPAGVQLPHARVAPDCSTLQPQVAEPSTKAADGSAHGGRFLGARAEHRGPAVWACVLGISIAALRRSSTQCPAILPHTHSHTLCPCNENPGKGVGCHHRAHGEAVGEC